MRHQRNRYQLSRSAAHRKSLLMNLSKEVIEHERIQTSEAKAKASKPAHKKLIRLPIVGVSPRTMIANPISSANKPVASFNRLSPSSMSTILLGSPSVFAIELAAIASV